MNADRGRSWLRAVAARAATVAVCIAGAAVILSGWSQPRAPESLPLQFPLQSPIDPTPTRPDQLPTPTPTPTAATPPAEPTIAQTPTFSPVPFNTPDMRLTSESVIATLTAQALLPTAPPTPVRRRPVGSGPDQTPRAPRTPTPPTDWSGIALISLSDRVYAGGAVALTIRTQPNAVCTVQIVRAQADGSQRSVPIPGGVTRRAGSDGIAAWIWSVGADEAAGPATLLVSCEAIGTAQYQIEVMR